LAVAVIKNSESISDLLFNVSHLLINMNVAFDQSKCCYIKLYMTWA